MPIRSYGEGSSGEGGNARARRDGRQHRKHDCRFQRDGAPVVTLLKLEEAKMFSGQKDFVKSTP
jgi:hypothetical protein